MAPCELNEFRANDSRSAMLGMGRDAPLRAWRDHIGPEAIQLDCEHAPVWRTPIGATRPGIIPAIRSWASVAQPTPNVSAGRSAAAARSGLIRPSMADRPKSLCAIELNGGVARCAA